MSSLKERKAHSLWVVEGVRNAQEGCLASCFPAGRLCIQCQLPASINSSLRENTFLHPGMLSFIWVIALVKWHTGKKNDFMLNSADLFRFNLFLQNEYIIIFHFNLCHCHCLSQPDMQKYNYTWCGAVRLFQGKEKQEAAGKRGRGC